MPTSIRSTSETLVALLERELFADPGTGPFFDPAQGGAMVVTLTNPAEMTAANLEGISLWLYEVQRDEHRTNAPPVRTAHDRIDPTPLPLSLHYLVTPIVRDDRALPERSPRLEQEFLGKVLQVFYRHPKLAGNDLAGVLAGTNERVHVRLDSMPIDDVARVWHALQSPYQLSVCYQVTLAHVRPTDTPTRIVPVTEVALDHGVIVAGGTP